MRLCNNTKLVYSCSMKDVSRKLMTDLFQVTHTFIYFCTLKLNGAFLFECFPFSFPAIPPHSDKPLP